MGNINQVAYNTYFNIKEDPSTSQVNNDIHKGQYHNTYGNDATNAKTKIGENQLSESDVTELLSGERIDNIDKMCELVRRILNAAWGDNWGEISPEIKTGENPTDIKLPQVTYDIFSREVPESYNIKPILYCTVKETVNGNHTGDAFNVYRQWFECVVEFNIWGRNSLEASQLANEFETFLGAYTGYLKSKGVSEMFFMKEVSPRQSIRYKDGIPMKCLLYYVKFERISLIRLSLLEKINISINTPHDKNFPVTTESSKSLNSGLKLNPDIIYNSNNVTYDLK